MEDFGRFAGGREELEEGGKRMGEGEGRGVIMIVIVIVSVA